MCDKTNANITELETTKMNKVPDKFLQTAQYMSEMTGTSLSY